MSLRTTRLRPGRPGHRAHGTHRPGRGARALASSAVVLSLGMLGGCFGVSEDVPPPTAEPTQDATTPEVPDQDGDGEESRLPDVSPPLAIEDLEAFSGVATMNAGSNCTGTLIDTGVPTGPAYVLTNGHCVGDVGRPAQSTTVDLEWFGTAEFLNAEGNEGGSVSVEVVQLAYSTMRHTDTAIARLDATLGELQDLGIRPVPLTDSEPAPGDAVTNVAVPVQGLDEQDWVLRRGECVLAEQHTLIELHWLWFDVWANDCPGVIQGSSGSPLLALDAEGEPEAVVGMINTTSWGVTAADGGACFINRPCQVSDSGEATMVEETSYAQSVAGIGRCFSDATGELALGGECPLPVSSVWSEGGGGVFRGGDLADATGRTPEVSLVGRVGGEGSFRSALVPIGDGSVCAEPDTYAGATSAALPEDSDSWELTGVSVPVTLPEEEGHYLLCAVNGEDYLGAASVLFEVDRTPPLFDASATVEDIGEGNVLIRPHLNPPEISTVMYIWGPAGETDCSDPATFNQFRIVPLMLEATDLPATYCVVGMDSAGNQTPVTELEIEAP